ncbi:MAG TPA: hypothetical protein VKD65_02830 [Candidatus Angelobacter sp.]|nr:hypothetical protein [Candidatus Angelobacter sp.]
MPAHLSEEELVKQARFIFQGTVRKLKASNMSAIEDTSRTIIVRVDEIIQAPEALAGYVGQDITIKLSSGEKVKQGEQAVFYTNGWMFAETIAVESIGHRAVEETPLALSATRGGDPARTLADRDVQKRLATADVVVTGKVSSIRVPADAETGRPSTARRMRSAEEEQTRRPPISEHDAMWLDAVVEVADVEKGSHQKKEIVIRFPSSNDVRWYKAPKFRPGQEGVFILHKTRKSDQPSTRRVAATVTDEEAETTEAYTALHPEDFQPLQQRAEIKTLIKATTDSDNS